MTVKLAVLAVMLFLFGTACDGYLSSAVDNVSPVVEVGPEGSGSGFVSVSAGDYHTCGLREDRSILCWGQDWYGMATPPRGSFDLVTAGSDFTCGLRTDGSVECWGDRIDEPRGQFLSISADGERVCGVTLVEDMRCGWTADSRARTNPPEGTFVAVGTGNTHICGIRSGGTVTCWSDYHGGQDSIPASTAGAFRTVSSGGGRSCGLTADGRLVCWSVFGNAPEWPPPPVGSFAEVSVGGSHACGLRSDRSVVCWGFITLLQSWGEGLRSMVRMLLGMYEESERYVVQGPFDSVSSGLRYACGVKSGGEVVCWGSNNAGVARPPVVRVSVLELAALAVALSLSLFVGGLAVTYDRLFDTLEWRLMGIGLVTVVTPFTWVTLQMVDLVLPSTFILTASFLAAALYFRSQPDLTISLRRRRILAVVLTAVSVSAATACAFFLTDPALDTYTSVRALDWVSVAGAAALASFTIPQVRLQTLSISQAMGRLALLACVFGASFLLLLNFGLSYGGAKLGAFLLCLLATIAVMIELRRSGGVRRGVDANGDDQGQQSGQDALL